MSNPEQRNHPLAITRFLAGITRLLVTKPLGRFVKRGLDELAQHRLEIRSSIPLSERTEKRN